MAVSSRVKSVGRYFFALRPSGGGYDRSFLRVISDFLRSIDVGRAVKIHSSSVHRTCLLLYIYIYVESNSPEAFYPAQQRVDGEETDRLK